MTETVRTYTWQGQTHPISSPAVTDVEVARRIRMLNRNDLQLEMTVLLARDRIMALYKEKQELEKALAGYQAENNRLEVEQRTLRRSLDTYEQYNQGNVWCYMNDGTDHIESLTCPVLIRPETLRELLKGG